MKTVWKNGLDKQGKLDIEHSFKSGAFLRGRLSDILKTKLKDSDKTAHLKEGYDCPNWAMKQADNVGYKRAMQEILSILED